MKTEDAGAMNGADDLASLQAWMQGVIASAGVVPRAQAEHVARAAGMGVDGNGIGGVVRPSATLSGAERMAIYARSYGARLLGCFETMFPCLRHALGEALFAHFALDYIAHHPPASYTLDHLADRFADHLRATRPDAMRPAEQREAWPDFIIELAVLEHATLRVFDGEGLEWRTATDGAGHEPAAIADLGPSALAGVVMVQAPSLRLLRLAYTVHEYYRAWRRGHLPGMPQPAESLVAVSRRDFRVRLDALPPLHFAVLERADGHTPLAELLSGLGEGAKVQPHQMRDLLVDWHRRWWIV